MKRIKHIVIRYPEEWTHDNTALMRRIQEAMDQEWPYAPMGTVEVLGIKEPEPPTSTQTDG